MDDAKLLKELLAEQSELKGISRDKLVASTGIPDRFIAAFLEGDATALPAAPYIRGYLKKLGSVLELDAEELWRAYERETTPRASGAGDRLPENRFALKTANKKMLVGAIALIAVALYAAVNAARLIGEPGLTVLLPAEETSLTKTRTVSIEGALENASDSLEINGEAVMVDARGAFKKSFPLEEGINSFQITAKRFLGKTVTLTRQVVYTPETAPEESPPTIPTPAKSP
ncbi:MAG: helix-turn-helix domain-containing protein [Candidatus Harrisonbacteria bacterium]|nr:helix-turn-helix domain-containing protein [Candidatus Harrisonbacteria bacterium]